MYRNGPKNIIVDLDGTISLDDHRRHLIPAEGWTAYFEACVDDAPNDPVIEAMKAFRDAGYHIHILTGRCETVREQTQAWLDNNKVPYNSLHMRKAADYDPTSTDSNPDNFRSDEDVKREMLQLQGLGAENVLMVLDDRDVMLKFWRENGYQAWQVRPEGKLY